MCFLAAAEFRSGLLQLFTSIPGILVDVMPDCVYNEYICASEFCDVPRRPDRISLRVPGRAL